LGVSMTLLLGCWHQPGGVKWCEWKPSATPSAKTGVFCRIRSKTKSPSGPIESSPEFSLRTQRNGVSLRFKPTVCGLHYTFLQSLGCPRCHAFVGLGNGKLRERRAHRNINNKCCGRKIRFVRSSF